MRRLDRGAGCGARCRASQARHRAVSGLRPAAIGPPARSLADGRSEFSAEQSRSLRHESAARTEETPRRSAVRRCALGTVGSQKLTVGRDRNGLCAFAALRPPHLQSSGANASRECERLFENRMKKRRKKKQAAPTCDAASRGGGGTCLSGHDVSSSVKPYANAARCEVSCTRLHVD